jgi:2'-5' RNA ligase
MSLRLFVAIEVPAPVKTALSKVREELQSLVPAARISWTRPESMHLTLRFLGDVSSSEVPPLIEALNSATRGFGEIPLVCERLGCFPAPRSPRVLWAGVHDSEDRLSELSRRITTASAAFTPEPPEARFTGHVTLGRIRQKLRGAEIRQIGDFLDRSAPRTFGTWKAAQVELMQSELGADGSRYTVVECFSLVREHSHDH